MKSQLLKSISESNNNTYAEGGEIKVKNIIMAKKDPIQYKGFTINYLRGEYRADAYASPQFTNTNLAKLKKEINEYLRDESKGGSTYKGGGEIKESDLSNWDKKLDAGEDVVVYDKNGVKYIYQGSSYEKDSVAVLKGFDESTYRMMPLDEIKSIEIGSTYAEGGMIHKTQINEDGSNMPEPLSDVFMDFDEDEDSYEEMERLRLKANEVGYDFDYDLSGQPTEFWEIEKNKMKEGGEVVKRGYFNGFLSFLNY